ncbi:hypothetical protein RM844_19940 [Streptomyces sp. DSM 44915]|uniref:PLAT domain-containing protein n=1 Tax=Streptomyces chisholmiae TaxID=3075540 RepID=A0ABU2JUB3_9ACTN|nr:hypothetical protein [Streptomyces sp. DSM 44915]MDT0268562.1 hypothetical protein [Streptomyces sp. DSM 44915]
MFNITRVQVEILTARESGQPTTGAVFLGFGGREFRLTTGDPADFQGNTTRKFELGGPEANVANAARNDPTRPQLTTKDLNRPVYLRFEPRGGQPEWVLEYALVRAFGPSGERLDIWNTPALQDDTEPKTHKIWLGEDAGLIYYLTHASSAPGPTPPDPPEPRSV